jgi:hypothetical protein
LPRSRFEGPNYATTTFFLLAGFEKTPAFGADACLPGKNIVGVGRMEFWEIVYRISPALVKIVKLILRKMRRYCLICRVFFLEVE